MYQFNESKAITQRVRQRTEHRLTCERDAVAALLERVLDFQYGWMPQSGQLLNRFAQRVQYELSVLSIVAVQRLLLQNKNAGLLVGRLLDRIADLPAQLVAARGPLIVENLELSSDLVAGQQIAQLVQIVHRAADGAVQRGGQVTLQFRQVVIHC